MIFDLCFVEHACSSNHGGESLLEAITRLLRQGQFYLKRLVKCVCFFGSSIQQSSLI